MNRREFLVAAAGVPFALNRSLGGTPAALVTADLESHVVAIELASGRVLKRVRTLPDPRSVEAVGAYAVVAHTAGGVLSIVDAGRLRIRSVVEGFDEPRYAAAARDGRHAYVTDSGSGEVLVVDVERGRIVHRTAVGGPARHISARGRLLFTALGTKAAEIAVLDLVDTLRPRLLAKLRPPFLAHDVGFGPEGNRVWVTSGDRGAIAVYDAARRKLLFRLPADAPPQHVTFSGSAAYVTSGDDGTLRVHAVRDGRLRRTTHIPVGSYNVQAGWNRVLTPSLSQGTVCLVDRHGRIVERLQVARSSHDACAVLTA